MTFIDTKAEEEAAELKRRSAAEDAAKIEDPTEDNNQSISIDILGCHHGSSKDPPPRRPKVGSTQDRVQQTNVSSVQGPPKTAINTKTTTQTQGSLPKASIPPTQGIPQQTSTAPAPGQGGPPKSNVPPAPSDSQRVNLGLTQSGPQKPNAGLPAQGTGPQNSNAAPVQPGPQKQNAALPLRNPPPSAPVDVYDIIPYVDFWNARNSLMGIDAEMRSLQQAFADIQSDPLVMRAINNIATNQARHVAQAEEVWIIRDKFVALRNSQQRLSDKIKPILDMTVKDHRVESG